MTTRSRPHDRRLTPHDRPLIASLYLHELRQEVADQLAALHTLQREHPEVAIVVAHDAELLRQHVASGLIREGFAE